jgi:hypothetical protein
MATNKIDGDLHVSGVFRPGAIVFPTTSIGDSEMTATRPIGVTKQVHQYNTCLGDARTTTIATTTGRFIYRAKEAGTVVEFAAGIIVDPITWAGGGQAVVDLNKNGISATSSTITIDGTTVGGIAGEQFAGFSSPSYTAGDVFEVEITVTAGTGTLPKGFYCSLTVNEAA